MTCVELAKRYIETNLDTGDCGWDTSDKFHNRQLADAILSFAAWLDEKTNQEGDKE